MKDRGDGLSDGGRQGGEGDALDNHREGVPLGHPLLTQQDEARIACSTEDQLDGVAISVCAEPGAAGPKEENGPEGGLAAELVEAVAGIYEQRGIRIVRCCLEWLCEQPRVILGLLGCCRRDWGQVNVPQLTYSPMRR